MPIKIDDRLRAADLLSPIQQLFELSADKILSLEKRWNPAKGTPVFTVKGEYTSRGWTEWTQGFQFGSAILQFEATGEKRFLKLARERTVGLMAGHLSHVGVHDHGFNNFSTYGNLLRLMVEGKIPFQQQEKHFYELALKISGAVQAARWTSISPGAGFIYSFNGPHSLFVDTIRSLRVLGIAHRLGHALMAENDAKISLLERLIQHAASTAAYSVYYGEGRDAYDVAGRTAHESIFNTKDGCYRCPNSQQGYSPFSTWTRGLAWAILGFAEQIEFLQTLPEKEFKAFEGKRAVLDWMLKAARATAGFYLEFTPACGIPYWDTGAPHLHRIEEWLEKSADPYNRWEPVDSSAAAIAGQGLIRLGSHLEAQGKKLEGRPFRQAGLTVARALFSEPYLSTGRKHQGLILHSVYHRPNGWDHIARGERVPNGESSMWGDYHARELALLIQREARGEPNLAFFNCLSPS
jgi:unsaturated chondroitin disaccharide hydrolase